MKDKNIIATLKQLSEDDSIVIIKPDKGNGIVILNKNDYLSKMETILQDSTKFKRLTDDCFKIIIRHENKVIRFLQKLRNDKPGIMLYFCGNYPPSLTNIYIIIAVVCIFICLYFCLLSSVFRIPL